MHSFVNRNTCRHQIAFACNMLCRDDGEPRVPLSVIGDFFGIAKGRREWQVNRSWSTPKDNGRPRTLPQEAYSHILNIEPMQELYAGGVKVVLKWHRWDPLVRAECAYTELNKDPDGRNDSLHNNS
jgi:hypothetical protein